MKHKRWAESQDLVMNSAKKMKFWLTKNGTNEEKKNGNVGATYDPVGYQQTVNQRFEKQSSRSKIVCSIRDFAHGWSKIIFVYFQMMCFITCLERIQLNKLQYSV